MEKIIILLAVFFLIVLSIIFKKIINRLELPNIEWNDQKELPCKLRKERSISVDVLIYDLDSKKLYLGYFSFSNELWLIDDEMKSIKQPTRFVWAYFN